MERSDRRTNQVGFEVGKLRYAKKPQPFNLWFDESDFRLTPLPPVIAVLEHGPLVRQDILDQCRIRFGVENRKADAMLAQEKNFLTERQKRHAKEFEIDQVRAQQADWWEFV